MNLTRTPSELADDAAEAVRSLNHVTMHRDAYKEPADINSTVANIEAMVHMLPQFLTQTTRTLQAMAESPGIRIDSGTDSSERVAETVHALTAAQRALQAVGAQLYEANQRLSTMGWHFSPDDATREEA